MTDYLKNIEALRSRIRDLHVERKQINPETRSREEVRAHVSDLVKRWKQEVHHSNSLFLRLVAAGQHPLTLNVKEGASLGHAMVLLLGQDAVEKALLQDIETVEEGSARSVRKMRLEVIATELDVLEAEEEDLIVAAEMQGHSILRRHDARPEIVLGRP